MCTRVYTFVYRRVHYCIHACTQVRSRYVLGEVYLTPVVKASPH